MEQKIVMKLCSAALLMLSVATVGTILSPELVQNSQVTLQRQLTGSITQEVQNVFQAFVMKVLRESVMKFDKPAQSTEGDLNFAKLNSFKALVSPKSGTTGYQDNLLDKGSLNNALTDLIAPDEEGAFMNSQGSLTISPVAEEPKSYIIALCRDKEEEASNGADTSDCILGIELVTKNFKESDVPFVPGDLIIRAFNNLISSEIHVRVSNKSFNVIMDFVEELAVEFLNKHLQVHINADDIDADLQEGLAFVFSQTNQDNKFSEVNLAQATSEVLVNSQGHGEAEAELTLMDDPEQKLKYDFRFIKWGPNPAHNPFIDDFLDINQLFKENNVDRSQLNSRGVSANSYVIVPRVYHMSPLFVTVLSLPRETKVIYTSSYYTTTDIFNFTTKPMLVKSIVQKAREMMNDKLIPLTILEHGIHSESKREFPELDRSFGDSMQAYRSKSFTAGSYTAVEDENPDMLPNENDIAVLYKNTAEDFKIQIPMLYSPSYTKSYPLNSVFDMSVFVKQFAKELNRQNTYFYPIKRESENSASIYKYVPALFAEPGDKVVQYFNDEIYAVTNDAVVTAKPCQIELMKYPNNTDRSQAPFSTEPPTKTINYECKPTDDPDQHELILV